ncbi:hypothetical protein VKT23_007580 [Stygiomarasmius scandens]|uniref:Uncharacterized protein n=1 Tax=Marasmiellus scandens TaxID=2682957 RepID=A0ABR1JK94_9AGAR
MRAPTLFATVLVTLLASASASPIPLASNSDGSVQIARNVEVERAVELDERQIRNASWKRVEEVEEKRVIRPAAWKRGTFSADWRREEEKRFRPDWKRGEEEKRVFRSADWKREDEEKRVFRSADWKREEEEKRVFRSADWKREDEEKRVFRSADWKREEEEKRVFRSADWKREAANAPGPDW